MHIAISGNIGAGKTTLAKKLADYFGGEVLLEAVDGNPYLANFYNDMSKWAFHLQIYFLNSRFEQLLKIKNATERIIIQDRSIYEDAYIFARNLYQTGLLNEIDYLTYESLFMNISKTIAPPDLMIYLRADLPKLLKQIKKRGRDFEINIDPNYLENLNDLYEGFVQLYSHGKLLVIDVNDLDYIEHLSDFEAITQIIERHINLGTQLEFA